MRNLLEVFETATRRKDDINIDTSFRTGDEIVVYIVYTDKDKERIQTFKGNVIQRRHPSSSGETFTVMKTAEGGIKVAVTFYINSPFIKSIKVLNRAKVRRARLFYLWDACGKRSKVKFRIIRNENDLPGDDSGKSLETKDVLAEENIEDVEENVAEDNGENADKDKEIKAVERDQEMNAEDKDNSVEDEDKKVVVDEG